MKNKAYIITLEGGHYDLYFQKPLFVTLKYHKATMFVRRFINLLRKQRKKIQEYEKNEDERVENLFWYKCIRHEDINVFIKEIELR